METIKTEMRGVRVMVFKATFKNISVISWQSVLLVKEMGVPGENHRPVAVSDNLYHIMLYLVHLPWVGFKLTMLVVIGTDCIGSCKSNYHMAMIAPWNEIIIIKKKYKW